MKTILLILSALSMFSCARFYEFSAHTEEKEMYRTFEMPVGKDTLDFNAYKDYYFDTIDLERVYVNAKELKKLKNFTLKSRQNKQILFLHNDTDFYLNIIGFYYPDVLLSEIKKPKFDVTNIPLTNGIGFEYFYNEKQIADFYIPYSNGTMRFLAIGNPEWKDYYSDRFHMEIDFVFYVINSDLFKLKLK